MADAFIVIGKRPDQYKKMYDVLNELILFGGSGCSNERKLVMALIKDKKYLFWNWLIQQPEMI